MKNTDFYAFCRDQRKVETDQHKRVVLQSVYGYMRECGVTKGGVKQYIDHCSGQESDQLIVAAYSWLQQVFNQ
jgi:hypothetical protein